MSWKHSRLSVPLFRRTSLGSAALRLETALPRHSSALDGYRKISSTRTFSHMHTPRVRESHIAVEKPFDGGRDSVGDAAQLHQNIIASSFSDDKFLLTDAWLSFLHEQALSELPEDRAATPWHRFPHYFCTETFKISSAWSAKSEISEAVPP